MTESEKICNEIGAKFFCKDYVYQGLKYRDAKNNKIELCDGLFEYGTNYIALQIKERAKETQGKTEDAWLQDVVYKKAANQIIKTIDGIKHNKITVKDLYQQPVELHNYYQIWPIIVFDNDKIKYYKRVIEVNKIKINILKLEDYLVMMKILIHPHDIIYYLQERMRLFTHSSPSLLFGESADVSIIAKVQTEKDFSSFFINYIYGGNIEKQNASLSLMKIINDFRKTQEQVNPDYKKLLKIFQMVEPKCAIGFIEGFKYAMNKSIENKFDITKNLLLLLDDKKIGITFCSVGHAPFNKEYYQVICDAKQLQHKTDIAIIISFVYDNSDKIHIDWIYYDKYLDDDDNVRKVYDTLGMYDGRITRELFEKLCDGIDWLKQ